jgi:TRAP-type mannitol/chloroaromatic compound transport system substrate-binding protein
MNRFRLTPRARRDLVRGILVVGLAAAAAAYFTARPPEAGPLGNPLEESKVYQRNLEVFGGSANLLATELREALAGWFRIHVLALGLAALTLAVAGGVLLATRSTGSGDRVP